MSTDSVSPLRQRMIEDMNARKLGNRPAATSLTGPRRSPRRGLLCRAPLTTMRRNLNFAPESS
jgi:hypothetical protein